ncbi:NRDE domain protein [Leptospira fluminis]|uniref:NRDE domain protein n=1 Tax=Leptospira fluminis TaxID=2484979 RepID=A0A4R9GNI3_9LEPT|nr:NRDE family protein [Leptospira fluminis]TGK17888.1 NRDE domain protein [Leptospira fluminis]
MCTALIYRNRTDHLYGLGFNRDESVKRKPSLSPRLMESPTGKAIAPIDGDAGGTWIGISQDGEIVCLLNYYEAALKLLRNPVSRGLLVRSVLLKERAPESWQVSELENYYPFKLFCIDKEKTRIHIWDGKVFSTEENTESFTVYGSSFTQGPKAQVSRREVFEKEFRPKTNPNAKDFVLLTKNFLVSHLPEKGALSPCMHRRDATSVSRTIFVVENGKVDLFYKPSQPCEEGPEEEFNFTLTDFRTFV